MRLKYVLILFLVFSINAFAQADKNQQIKVIKHSRMASALDLNASESKKFWPLYMAYEDKEYDIRHDKIHPITQKLEEKGIDGLSQKEALLYLTQLQSADDELFNLRKKLINDLRHLIGPVKILKLIKAEEDFNKWLLQKYKGKKD